jgi:hypothetical protein
MYIPKVIGKRLRTKKIILLPSWSLTKIAGSGSGSVSQRYRTTKLDQYQNVPDPQPCCNKPEEFISWIGRLSMASRSLTSPPLISGPLTSRRLTSRSATSPRMASSNTSSNSRTCHRSKVLFSLNSHHHWKYVDSL